ncbi:hypothetical protein [Methyloversatilis sp. XJ19-49]|uniref:hypothetical protein n=1 Tax=Methyloversatilis sp. XJ19-49 TaxID=2963429 RepID=UPI00211C2A7A|nr:hypothetical protein [Methyloversatilis sp. XJ19-49]MCQ9377912.1 hypothetical protein [Methyloversatilis sp. XJ19-49]
MSIAPVIRLTLFGPTHAKDATLLQAQELGCLHIEPLDRREDVVADRPQARRALAFLLASPVRRHAAHSAERFDAEAVEAAALRIEARLRALDEEKRTLIKRLRVLAPWGDYPLDPDLLARGLRLWFYVLPHWRLAQMPEYLTAWKVVAHDQRNCWVAVVHPDEPHDMPVPREHTGSVALHALQHRLHDLDAEHDDLLAERIALTRWCDALAHSLTRLEDQAERKRAAGLTREVDGLFALSAWAPAAALPDLQAMAGRIGLAMVTHRAPPAELPPTWLDNSGIARSGQNLLGIFLTPGYRSWDPSTWVLVSFVVFFGMVMADAGYALVMLFVLLALRLRRRPAAGEAPGAAGVWPLAWLLAASTGAWGLGTGTWFGSALPASHPMAALRLLDGTDFRLMMRLSLLIGVLHLTLASLAQARLARGWSRIAAAGWSAVLAGGGLAGFSIDQGWGDGLRWTGQSLLGAGLLAALTAAVMQGRGLGGRAAALLAGLMRLPAALGDTLSYLRLFALGFAGASLATAFNDLARQTLHGVPGFGVLLAGLLLLLGHTLNLVLGIAGGLVHGLRLNFIEFLNWSGVEEGRPFKPFKLKDAPPWMHRSR